MQYRAILTQAQWNPHEKYLIRRLEFCAYCAMLRHSSHHFSTIIRLSTFAFDGIVLPMRIFAPYAWASAEFDRDDIIYFIFRGRVYLQYVQCTLYNIVCWEHLSENSYQNVVKNERNCWIFDSNSNFIAIWFAVTQISHSHSHSHIILEQSFCGEWFRW